jgi:hypothetical protein
MFASKVTRTADYGTCALDPEFNRDSAISSRQKNKPILRHLGGIAGWSEKSSGPGLAARGRVQPEDPSYRNNEKQIPHRRSRNERATGFGMAIATPWDGCTEMEDLEQRTFRRATLLRAGSALAEARKSEVLIASGFRLSATTRFFRRVPLLRVRVFACATMSDLQQVGSYP